jgi:hypothetical protein
MTFRAWPIPKPVHAPSEEARAVGDGDAHLLSAGIDAEDAVGHRSCVGLDAGVAPREAAVAGPVLLRTSDRCGRQPARRAAVQPKDRLREGGLGSARCAGLVVEGQGPGVEHVLEA